jgi:acetyl esterase/lipase
VACLTFYGELYWADPSWSSPKASLAGLPELPKDFRDKVFDEGIVVSAPSTREADGKVNLSRPRNVWLLTSIKEGWWLKEIVKDGNLDRIEPSILFSPSFPPTCFIHGTSDVVCSHNFSERAYESLKASGVDTKLILVEDKGHDFEVKMSRHDQDFAPVREGLRFLADKIAS